MKSHERAIISASAVDIARAKSISNVSKVVRTGEGSEIFFNSKGRLTVRKVGRSGVLNAKAQQLRKCKGKKGAEFKTCAGLSKGKK